MQGCFYFRLSKTGKKKNHQHEGGEQTSLTEYLRFRLTKGFLLDCLRKRFNKEVTTCNLNHSGPCEMAVSKASVPACSAFPSQSNC